jgi:hypothetical protein
MPDLVSPSSALPSGWADRLTSPVRLALLALTMLAFVFSLGILIGVAVATFEHGYLKPRGAALLAGGIVALGLFGWLGWRLSAHWRRPGRSAYERRYTRMVVILIVLGLPLGVLSGVISNGRPEMVLLGTGPLDPLLAGAGAALLALILGTTLVIYHRAIDDHEQQAYLWANSLAFYALVISLPAAWLLSRGGLIPPLGFGSALLILGGALAINLTVWLWLKFR